MSYDDLSTLARIAMVRDFCAQLISGAQELRSDDTIAANICADICTTVGTIVDKIAAGDLDGVAELVATFNPKETTL